MQIQSDWLAEARSRMLRLAEIARRKSVLDLGSGYGIVTRELRRRTSGMVVALDRSVQALSDLHLCVAADAIQLPFREKSFDLVFCQNVLLWITDKEGAIKEVARVLQQGGVWVLLEPDYGSMIEHPPEVQSSAIWCAALERCGADPMVGRKLPLLLRGTDFRVRTDLLPRLENPGIERFDFLLDLGLTTAEESQLQQIKKTAQMLSPTEQISHLPYFLIIAERC